MSFDVAVIGAGMAGLVAALRVAEEGGRVVVLATGVGSIQLAPGTVDVLGYAPQRVDHPAEAVQELTAARPEHPYARLPPGSIDDAVAWFKRSAAALDYVGGTTDNMLLPTPVGVAKPTALAPSSMAEGDLRAGGRVLVVGMRELKDFYPAYVAANLGDSGGIEARSLELRVEVSDADVTPLGFARRFDDAEWRKAVIADLEGRIQPGEDVAFPAVLGLEQPEVVRRELQDGLGARVFEIPTLPPSVPGIRLFRLLKRALGARGGRLVLGSAVVGATSKEGVVDGVMVQAASRPIWYHAEHFVLATGGFAAGGITMDSRWQVRETVFDLPLSGVPAVDQERSLPGYFDDHPLARAGVAVDEQMRPTGVDGGPVFRNLYAAGATIAGARPWREKSGDGISLSTGYGTAAAILKESA
jgi:glycerol-3-phosphate dehydrogenase subunit B